uniref:Serine/threonine-protein phosphatase 2A 55 kDa regulatory subunit B n=1 Tax=Quercus lobata TaxID=97700 RepID=A0A7N2LKS5_QUELO
MNGGDEVVAAPVDPPQPLEWKFSQVFGERTAGEEVQEGKILTTANLRKRRIVVLDWCYICKSTSPMYSGWLWRFGMERAALWRQVIAVKYGCGWGSWCTRPTNGPYGVGLWKNISRDGLLSLTTFYMRLGMGLGGVHARELEALAGFMDTIYGASVGGLGKDKMCWKFDRKKGFTCNGESVDHLFLHCPVAMDMWAMGFGLFGVSWVMPQSVVELLAFDIISAIEFDKTGDHLATGDRGGRVVLFERTDTKDHGGSRRDLERLDYPIGRHPEFRYKTEFQSHEPEFDYLKSLEIEEKINKIRWCQTANGALFLLSTNDKTIKFWKVQEKKIKKISDMNLDSSKAVGNCSVASSSNSISPRPYLANGGCPDRSYSSLSNELSFPPGGIPSLRLPMVVVASHETSLVARCRRVYAHAHDYHINSISNNSDGETFISADDLRINLWNLEISNQSFNIVDVKPANMEDLTEVITSAEFHPSHCNMLGYSSSKGSIRLIDLRQSALCDSHAKLFEEPEPPGTRSFFTEIIASISDIKFGKDGRYILSRDYMTLKRTMPEQKPDALHGKHVNRIPCSTEMLLQGFSTLVLI